MLTFYMQDFFVPYSTQKQVLTFDFNKQRQPLHAKQSAYNLPTN